MVGEASIRESAAYLLDHRGFSGVPCTDLVLCQHPSLNSNSTADDALGDASESRAPGTPIVNTLRVRSPRGRTTVKLGSFQAYKDHDGDADDVPPSLLAQFPVDEVHKIAVLDVRLFNSDRHGGNILWVRRRDEEGDGGDKTEDGKAVSPTQQRATVECRPAASPRPQLWRPRRLMAISDLMATPAGGPTRPLPAARQSPKKQASITLVPIDHSYTLPTTLTEAEFVWLSWPQSKQPMSPRTLEYIRSLDAEEDVRLLREKFGNTIRPESLRVLRISTMWLKKGAEAGLTLYEIGDAMCRQLDRSSLPSALERMVFRAQRKLTEKGPDSTTEPSTPLLATAHPHHHLVQHVHALSAPSDVVHAVGEVQGAGEQASDRQLLGALSGIMDEEISRLLFLKAAKN